MIKYYNISTLLIMLFQAAYASHPEAAQLIQAAAQGELAVVHSLLESKVDPNSVDSDRRTALHWAAWKNHPSIVQLLLERGASINAQDNYKDTPLILAGMYGALDALKVLIDNGADDTITNKDKRTVVTEIINIPEYRNVSPDIREAMRNYIRNFASTSPVVRALLKQQAFDIIEPLITDQAILNSYDNHGRTALITVIEQADAVDLVNFLLGKGADPNLPNQDNSTNPLMCAIQKGRLVVAQRLLELPTINADQPNRAQRTPLMYCTDKTLNIVRLLLPHKKRANIEARDETARTPLMHAAHNLQLNLVELLHRRDANVNAQDRQGETPLLLVARKIAQGLGPEEFKTAEKIVTFLLNNGADVSLVGANKQSFNDLVRNNLLLQKIVKQQEQK